MSWISLLLLGSTWLWVCIHYVSLVIGECCCKPAGCRRDGQFEFRLPNPPASFSVLLRGSNQDVPPGFNPCPELVNCNTATLNRIGQTLTYSGLTTIGGARLDAYLSDPDDSCVFDGYSACFLVIGSFENDNVTELSSIALWPWGSVPGCRPYDESTADDPWHCYSTVTSSRRWLPVPYEGESELLLPSRARCIGQSSAEGAQILASTGPDFITRSCQCCTDVNMVGDIQVIVDLSDLAQLVGADFPLKSHDFKDQWQGEYRTEKFPDWIWCFGYRCFNDFGTGGGGLIFNWLIEGWQLLEFPTVIYRGSGLARYTCNPFLLNENNGVIADVFVGTPFRFRFHILQA